jgi:formylglycine-generating enzyme required for sulfatase activity
MVVVSFVTAGAAIIVGAASCLSFGDLSGGDADANASEASTAGDASNDDAAVVPGDAGSDATADGDGACKGTAGPTQVRVPTPAGETFCIDSTEVTLGQYEQFEAAVEAGAPVTQPAPCAFNTSIKTTDSNGDMFTPVDEVNWCDAYAFCAWAGKRLCGRIGGGSLGSTNIGDPAVSQWMRACAISPDGGTENYPYGNSPSATACNGTEHDAGGVVDVGSLPRCVGGMPGLFDMSGNVDEWTDGCSTNTGADDCCDTRGGGFGDTETPCGIGDMLTGSCTNRTRKDAHTDVGFRCCSD